MEKYIIELTSEQYDVIKKTLLQEQAKAFMKDDVGAFEKLQSAYQAVIGCEKNEQ